MQAPHRSLAPADDAERFLVELLDALWERYHARVEPARRFEAMVEAQGRAWRNDHVAFRAVAWQKPASGLFTIARPFEALGYAAAGCYEFPDKKLSAVHYRHRNAAFPKLFISELKAWELSPGARAVLARSLERQAPSPLGDDALAALASGAAADRAALLQACLEFFTRRPWPAPERADMQALDRESQYGAWVLAHGREVNHFTGAVDDIERAVADLRAAGVAMKAEIEGAKGSPLRQSSTEAVVLPVEVSDGGAAATMPWTYAYFELAERSQGFEGFFGPQATNLFDMTKFAGPRR